MKHLSMLSWFLLGAFCLVLYAASERLFFYNGLVDYPMGYKGRNILHNDIWVVIAVFYMLAILSTLLTAMVANYCLYKNWRSAISTRLRKFAGSFQAYAKKFYRGVFYLNIGVSLFFVGNFLQQYYTEAYPEYLSIGDGFWIWLASNSFLIVTLYQYLQSRQREPASNSEILDEWTVHATKK